MQLRIKERALTIAVVTTTVVIAAFAWAQYRWSTEVTLATGVRLADTLQMSIVNWHVDFSRNFEEIARALGYDADDGEDSLAEIVPRLHQWKAAARYPDLVSGVYVVEPAATPPQARRLVEATGQFEAVAWPDTLTLPAGLSGDVREWRFDPDAPAILRRLAASDRYGDGRWLAVMLSHGEIRTRILPDLANRYFQGTDGLDYEVAVAAGTPPRTVMYASDPGFGSDDVPDADGRMNVFARAPIEVFHKTSEHLMAAAAIGWFPLLNQRPHGDDWELVVRHRRGGPLGAFVANSYRRDLLYSFGALLLLVASIAMLVVTSVRAQRLASLQMDFVTTVSHELRTPLTVIGSAADNIAQGVVASREQMTQYGMVIGSQVGQLSALVEQILLFATQSKNLQRFNLRPVGVAEAVDATLSSTDNLVRAKHFQIETDLPASLPAVMGDPGALSQCLQNLITNALKYSRDERWIGIRARLVERGLTGREVQVEIADRGIGIAASDLPHIFEPFYRSPSVTAAQIHGTGLGLSLAKSMIEGMGGRISVVSEPGRGSTFTLHLPCAATAPRDLNVELHPVSHHS